MLEIYFKFLFQAVSDAGKLIPRASDANLGGGTDAGGTGRIRKQLAVLVARLMAVRLMSSVLGEMVELRK